MGDHNGITRGAINLENIKRLKERDFMTEETREEIMKALAYGLDPATVAQCNGVTIEEVNAIAAERAQRVAGLAAELKEVYPDAF